jgi:Domain of unknown function (DUF4145)
MKINWECPFCRHKAVVHDGEQGTVASFLHRFTHDNKYGDQVFQGLTIVCPNAECREYSIVVSLHNYGPVADGNKTRYAIHEAKRNWRLIPDSSAKTYPSYIPRQILDDYREACLIKDMSPKASATLSRRCLQGIIRDFWKVSKPRLVEEIDAIQDRVDSETWEAIDSVRKIGNIGAHMEKDINVIVDVEPEEASLLINLMETLLEDWYVARHERQQRMQRIKAVADAKEQVKQGVPKMKN